ncbi:unnamed protein product [Urochloa humidicola]
MQRQGERESEGDGAPLLRDIHGSRFPARLRSPSAPATSAGTAWPLPSLSALIPGEAVSRPRSPTRPLRSRAPLRTALVSGHQPSRSQPQTPPSPGPDLRSPPSPPSRTRPAPSAAARCPLSDGPIWTPRRSAPAPMDAAQPRRIWLSCAALGVAQIKEAEVLLSPMTPAQSACGLSAAWRE